MNVDTEKNKEYYKTAEPCQCDVCRYFCRHIRKALPEVADHLDTLNVDIEKPFELIWMDCNDDGHIDFIGCQYIVFGSCDDDLKLKIGDIDFINNTDMHPTTGIEEEHFVLDFGKVTMDMKEQ